MASIAEIYLAQGRQLADARRRRGDLIGNTVATLAQVPGDIYAQRLQEKAQQVAAERQQTQDARIQKQDERADVTFTNETQDRKAERAKQDAAQVVASGYAPDVVAHVLDTWEKDGIITPEEGAQLNERISTPEGRKHTFDFIAQIKPVVPKAPEAFELSEGQTAFNPDGTIRATVPKPKVPDKLTFGQPQVFIVGGKRTPIRSGSDGKPYDMGGRPIDPDTIQALPATPTAASLAATGQSGDVKEAVAGMRDGTLPPQLPGRASKEYIEMMAEAHRQGYDLAQAATDWVATQKHISTLNNAQQTRLNQSINALPELLDSVDALASKWKGGRFPILNKANLAAAKNGAYGDEVASVARQLDAQIADVTADLGSVYMGGNSPTDHALTLAGKSLAGDWSEKVLHDMVTLAKKNVIIRRNSIANTGVQGASVDNPYAPPPQAPPADAGSIVVTAPDGSKHPFATQAQADAFKKLAGIK